MLLETVKTAFSEVYAQPELPTFEQSNTGHGRKERRTLMQIEASLPAELKKKWPHITSLIEVASERTVNGKTSCSSRWLSVPCRLMPKKQPMLFMNTGVENQLHWVLDVVFREDALKVTAPDGAKHLALFNRAALNALRQHQGKKDSLAGNDYHQRSLSETGMYRYKQLIGDKLSLRNYNAQVGEALAGVKVMNKVIGLGMPVRQAVNEYRKTSWGLACPEMI
jgi:hypothetical protein